MQVTGPYLDCMHCGLCLQSCPTYLESGNENDSPRGRIFMLRAVAEGRVAAEGAVLHHLDRCLDCRGCESACPSGVPYARLLEPFRVAQAQANKRRPTSAFQAWMLRKVLPDRRRLKRFLAPMRLVQKLGLDRLARRLRLPRLLPSGPRTMLAQLPRLQPAEKQLPATLAPLGQRRGRVGLLLGCAAEGMFPGTNRAIARVLQANGYEVAVPSAQSCCGALAYHEGRGADALQQLQANARAFAALGEIDAVVINAAGCGSMLKEAGVVAAELGLEGQALSELQDLAASVEDVNRFLHQRGLRPPSASVPLRVVYDDACHLAHAQGIREDPRALLAAIPNLELLALEESELCCGAAGSYSLQQPEMSRRLGARKAACIVASGADAVVTANVGCAIQIENSLRRLGKPLPVYHPLQLLDRSYAQSSLTDPR